MNQFEIVGEVTFVFQDGRRQTCRKVCVCSDMGVETWLYIDKETGELALAEQIDGEWTEIDREWAEEHFSDVLYAVR